MKKLTPKHWLLNGRLLLILLLLALFTGCSDSDEEALGSTAPSGSLKKLFSHSVIQGCGSCHSPDSDPAGPDLRTRSSFHYALVNRTRRDDYPNWFITSETCPGSYVEPSSPKDSSILSIITNQNGSTCGAYNIHTVQGGEISGKALSDFMLWIENGAPNN